MLLRILKAIWSTIVSPARMPGRRWSTEVFARTLHRIFSDGHERGTQWLRYAVANPGLKNSFARKMRFTDRQIAGTNCVLAHPADWQFKAESPQQVIVYLHGGGFVVGAPSGYHSLLSQLALQTSALVIAPDYKLSPEHPFPEPQLDCQAVVRAVAEAYPDCSLVIGGDSAGANLAVSSALALANTDVKISGLFLISPWIDPTATDGTVQSNAGNDIFEPHFLQASYAEHIGDADPQDPRVNLAHADLRGLPRTYSQAGGGELFCSQIEDFQTACLNAGVDAKLDVWDTQFHVFQVMSPLLKDARDAVAKLSNFISQLK